jgi:competence protein ComEC
MAELFFFSAGLAFSTVFNSCLSALFFSFIALSLLLFKSARPLLKKALLLLFLFLLGITAGDMRLPLEHSSLLKKKVAGSQSEAAFWIEGKVISSEPGRSGSKAVIQTASFYDGAVKIPDENRVQVYLPFEPPLPGSRFKASVFLFLPKEGTNPGQFDYRKNLSEKGIYLVGRVKDKNLFTVLDEGRLPFIGRYRDMIRNQISNYGGDESGVILALLLGERGLIDESSESYLVRSGLYHLVALSGFNIGMIMILISFFFVILRLEPSSADIFAIIFLPVYGLLIGHQPSVWRAILMGLIYLGGRLSARPHAALRAVLIAFAALLFINPYEIRDVGFLLTFSATLGIIVLYKKCPLKLKAGSLSDYALKLFWVGFSAQVFTLPFLAYYFQRVSPAGFIWTPLAALPMFPLFALGIVYLFGGCFIPGFNILLISLMKFFTKLFLFVPEWSSSKSFSTLFIPRPAFFYLIAFALSMAIFMFAGRRKMAGVVLFVFVLMTAYFFPDPFKKKIDDSLIVVDVGQGASQLLLYDDRVYFVDAADTSYQSVSTARTVIEPLLARLHLNRIDGIFITHWDKDHAGSIDELALDLPIGFAAYPKSVALPQHYYDLLLSKKIKMIPLEKGDKLSLGRAEISILHPPPYPVAISENNLSLVLNIRIDNKNILFTGDIEKEGETILLEDLLPFKTDILIAPHHGAKNALYPPLSSAVSPDITVFSVGLNNRFNHPNPAVVDHYRSIDSKILRTDKSGAILFKLGQDKMTPLSYTSFHWEDELWQKKK